MTEPSTPTNPGVPSFEPPAPFAPSGPPPAAPYGSQPLPDARPTEQAGAGPQSPEGAYPYPVTPPGADQAAAVIPVPTENVGRGLLFSLLAVVIGAVASALIYQAGFLASITSLLMAAAAGWLYAKGAGAAPRRGALALILVIVAGAVVSLLAMLGLTLYNEIAAAYPGVTAAEIMPVVFDNLFYPPVWEAFATDALIFLAFAALGAFGTIRQLRRAAAAG